MAPKWSELTEGALSLPTPPPKKKKITIDTSELPVAVVSVTSRSYQLLAVDRFVFDKRVDRARYLSRLTDKCCGGTRWVRRIIVNKHIQFTEPVRGLALNVRQ